LPENSSYPPAPLFFKGELAVKFYTYPIFKFVKSCNLRSNKEKQFCEHIKPIPAIKRVIGMSDAKGAIFISPNFECKTL
ncbi:MAG: hypothetical protein NC303_03860, partial [Firmicutes bacterium]|nr:hypothetical protein [Bacillota bacterium]